MSVTIAPPMFLQFLNPNNTGSPAVAFKLFTYMANSSTKLATWTDSTQITQNANPLFLDGNGVAAGNSSAGIWGDPTLLYKFVWAPANDTDPPSSPIRTIDNISFPVNVSLLTQSFIGSILYPRTAAEIAASVTPTNYAYPPGNVLRYGTNTIPGTTDMSTPLQNACNANSTVYVPSGTYLCSNILVPNTAGLVIYGDGTSSILKQKADGNPVFKWNTSTIHYTEGYIERLAFNGSVGTNHTINTAGVGGITLQDLYFTDVPVGYSSIYCDGAAATYTHDQRLRNIQIYYSVANGGHSGIRLGPLSSDASIEGFIMNGGFQVSYCIYADSGSQTHQISDSHPYNALVNIFFGSGSSADFTFDNVVFDNATQDLVVLTGFSNTMFSSCWFEATKSGKNSLTLTNCQSITLDQVRFDGAAGAGYCINETGTTNYTVSHSISSTGIANFNNPPFNLIGANSVYPGPPQTYFGATSGVIAAGSTVYLGANGAQAAANQTQWCVTQLGGVNVMGAEIAFDASPGVGQSYTIGLYGNGGLLTAASGSANPQVVTGAGLSSTSIKIAQGSGAFLAQFKSLYLQVVTTGGAATPNMQYGIDVVKNSLPS